MLPSLAKFSFNLLRMAFWYGVNLDLEITIAPVKILAILHLFHPKQQPHHAPSTPSEPRMIATSKELRFFTSDLIGGFLGCIFFLEKDMDVTFETEDDDKWEIKKFGHECEFECEDEDGKTMKDWWMGKMNKMTMTTINMQFKTWLPPCNLTSLAGTSSWSLRKGKKRHASKEHAHLFA